MDVTKVQAAIDEAHKQLNTVIDAAFAARQIDGLRSLTNAANALTLAEGHVKKAVTQTTPKAEPVAAAPAKGKK